MEANNWPLSTFASHSDVKPPIGTNDERLQRLYESATALAQANNCSFDNNNPLASLTAIYAAPVTLLDSGCMHSLMESTLPQLLAPERGYLVLRNAIWNLRRGASEKALVDFESAEGLGVSKAWRYAFCGETCAPRSTAKLAPSHILNDNIYLGFDIDPIQMTLGVPLDVILYQKLDRQGQDVDIVVHTTPNLAPNAGFEFGSTEPTCAMQPCISAGYEFDMYSPQGEELSQYTHHIVLAERPATGGPNGQAVSSKVLNLGNPVPDVLAKTSSSLISYKRQVDDDKRYLQAAWMRSDSGNAFLGYEWASEKDSRQHEYTASDPDNSDWQYFSGIHVPNPSTSAVRLWLINYNAAGSVEFDDLLFIQLPE